MASTKEDLGKLKLGDLQTELEKKGLSTVGKKSELVDRLFSATSGAANMADSESKPSVRSEGTETEAGSTDVRFLITKLRILKEKQSVEQERLALRARAEQLDLEMKLAELGHFDSAEVRAHAIVGSRRTEPLSKTEEVLSSQLSRSLLPAAKLRPFSGEVEEFRLFMKAFEARIASRTEDPSELISYLEQYTTGKPNQLVRGCLHLGTKGYAEAVKLLEERYGDSIRLSDSYVAKLRAWPRLSAGDVEALDKFTLFLTEANNATKGSTPGDFDHPITLRIIVEKLPSYLQDRWQREADRLTQQPKEIRFSDMVKFLTVELRVKRSALFGSRGTDSGRASEGSGPPQRHRVNAARVTETGRRCVFCGGAHSVEACRGLARLSWPERRRAVMEARLCFACLGRGHRARMCRAPLTCDRCGAAHPSVMHRDPEDGMTCGAPGRPPSSGHTPHPRGGGQPFRGSSQGQQWPRTAQPGTDRLLRAAPPVGATAAPPVGGVVHQGSPAGAVVSASLGLHGESRTALPVVAVRVRGASGRELVTNGFLDQGSSGSFMTDKLADRLGVPTEHTSVSIDTVGNCRRTISTSVASGVEVCGLDDQRFHSLPPLFTVDSLPVTPDDRCGRKDVESAAHLMGVELRELDAPVELLIGSNCAELIVAREVRSPPEGQSGLCAVRTMLGWYVMGRVSRQDGSGDRLTINFLRVQEMCHPDDVPMTQDVPVCEGDCQYRAMYEQGFREADDRECLSVEDKEWMKEVESGIKRDAEGHFEVPLPKVEFSELPDSFKTASVRLSSLRRRFQRDPQYFEQYRSVMRSLSEDGYAVPVTDQDTADPVWYIPHHGVMEEGKNKLRVVFDCAARSQGVCLNDLLKKGPNLTNSLLGVLCRFREGPVAFTCDVKSMFHRVHVPEADRNLLRFLWFQDDDLEGEVVIWRMKSHVFGAVSSSSVASFALNSCAEEGRSAYPEAADVLLRKTYVDDALCATDSVERAVKLARDLKELCLSGAFNMTKFTSTSPDFLRQIPVEDRGKGVKDLDLDKDSLGSSRALGLKWLIVEDSFYFQFKDPQKPLSRRGLLSTVSSVFDPLGIVAPVTLTGRVLLQKLCALRYGWDDPLPDALAAEWRQWLALAGQLDDVRLRRCIMGPPGDVLCTRLHIFADASEMAYSAVAYLVRRVQAPGGGTERFVTFLMGKSLVNPVRPVSIPRLELAAAVLAVKMRRVLTRELDTEFSSAHLWTDSMVVLGYLRNRTARFRTYVANRVAYIHGGSDVAEWSYVPSRLNPADIGSRGCQPADLGPWLSGPEFISGEPGEWPEEPAVQVALPESEVKPSPVALVCVGGSRSPCDTLIGRFSSFCQLKRAVAWFRKFFKVIRDGTFRRWCLAKRRGLRSRTVGEDSMLRLSDLRGAEYVLLRYVQRTLPELPRGDCEDGPVMVKKGSPLSKIRPHMINGLLVVGGRIGRSACVSEETKHPVILPRRHHVTELVLREAHESVGHEGRDHTFWRLRQKYWVVGAGPEIRKMIRSCVTCRKVNARPQRQLMADLPLERVSAETPAFSTVLLDVFGPILVRNGRVERKRYALMCVCTVTRAVHVELLDSLRTDSLINAIQRISARRGPIRHIRSDRGTNLTGADRELRESLCDSNRGDLQSAALRQGIEWNFNPPTASHFGGGVERQIRTFRKIWRSMPTQRRMDDESTYTLFCEIESIMNSRPLTYISTSSGDIEPLTPGHLLFLRGNGEGIPGEFSEADSLSRRRWRQVQYLAGQFWIRWKREYLRSLQSRQKWRREVRNLEEGDVVLLVDQDVSRRLWQMGRIVRTLPSPDGLIRKALVKTGGSTYLRPIHKMVLVSSKTDLD